MKIHKKALTADEIKRKAKELGADLVGIADGSTIDASHITELDAGRVIVLAKRLNDGVARIKRWDDRHKYYNDELALTHLEETSLELVYWLEDCGYPALIVPPTHVDPQQYQDDPKAQALCKGPSCGRCLKTCPADAVKLWERDWPACDRFRSPHGFAQLTEHLQKIIEETNPQQRKTLLKSEDSFYLWQSILRGAGVVTGCRRCADVCPVGADYATMLGDALEEIPENTPAKEKRLAGMTGDTAEYRKQKRFIGILKQS